MKTIFTTTQEIINICTQSSYLQRQGNPNYFYVYMHINPITQQPFYIGQGSHNRAYKYKGRSGKWYKAIEEHDCKVFIIKSNLSFEESLIEEKKYIELYKNFLINEEYGHSPNESFLVLCFDKKGNFLKKYKDSKEAAEIIGCTQSGISGVCSAKGNKRKTLFNLIWCYEKDYENIKENLFIRGITHSKKVKIIFPDNSFKIYNSINSTIKDDFLPAKVRAVCIGERKSHKNCKCEYITNL